MIPQTITPVLEPAVADAAASATPRPAQAGRRAFLTRAATLAAGVAGAGALLSTGRGVMAATQKTLKFSDIPGTGDIKVLNYALLLEAFEAEVYRQAIARLTKGGKTPNGTTIPGLGVPEYEPDVRYLRQFAVVENQHRDFLIGALGSASILKNPAFKNLDPEPGVQSLTRKQVVNLIYTVELTGVGAYLGAIPFFATKTYLQTAGAIQGTEARHTAVVAEVYNLLFNERLAVAPPANVNHGIDAGVTPDDVLKAVSPLVRL